MPARRAVRRQATRGERSTITRGRGGVLTALQSPTHLIVVLACHSVATVVASANHGRFYLPFLGKRGGSLAKSTHLVALATAVAALAAVVVLGLIEAQPAEATFPGKNGKIAFQSDSGGNYDIYTMNRNGEKIAKLTTNPADDEDPAFSPDGKRIAFTSDRDGDNDIYTMNAKGRRLVQLTTNTTKFDRDPSWSPDGKTIVFRSDRHGSSDIYMMNVKGHKVVRLTTDPAVDTDANWSLDGKKIVFASNRNGNDYDIYKMNANGTREIPLTTNQDIDDDPAFSPDGKKIAFESDRDGDSDVYKMTVKGRKLVRLTSDPATTFGADWAVK